MTHTHDDNNDVKGTILIVDDMPNNLRLLSAMLIERGYKVRAVINGAMAIRSANTDSPDIILLDINMPDMNGYEVCTRLKSEEKTRHIPIIFISALDETVDKIKAFNIGGVDYITKPFQIEEVLARISTHMSLRHMQQTLQEQNEQLHKEITERRTIEIALRESEERLRTMADYTYDWEYWLGTDNRPLYMSPSCERITGYSVSQFMNDPDLLIRITHPDDQKRIRTHIHGIANTIGVRFLEFRIITHQGDERWISHTCQPVYTKDGTWLGIRASNRDITEQKRAEEGLRKFQRAVQQSPASIVITDLKGNIEYVNPKFTQVAGYTFDETQGQNPRVLKSGEYPPEKYRELWETITAGHEWRGEFHNRRKNGELFWEFASISPIFDDKGKITHYLAIKEDITERKRTEERLKEAYQHLKLLNERMQSELTVAQRIQQSLLPDPTPPWHCPDMVCYNVPAREVGGDLYAYHAFTSAPETECTGRYVIAVGDISGKGMPAALLMAISMASFDAIVAQSLGVQESITQLDTALSHYTSPTRQNCAMVYIEIEILATAPQPANSSPYARMQVANAGCVYPLIKRANGSVLWIDVRGLPLGVGLDSKMGYQTTTLTLMHGDMIILTSDGVIEAQSETMEMFGFDRLEQAVKTGPQSSANDMIQHIRTEVEDFMGEEELHDDMTIVVIHV